MTKMSSSSLVRATKHLGEPVVVRGERRPGLKYGAYREPLRRDFCWSCAYCSRGEMEVSAVGFEIDHHHPQVSAGTDEYENLYWACRTCNRDKSGFVPRYPPDHRRLIRADLEDPDAHITLSDDLETAEPRTDVGQFHVGLLYLNSQQHKRVRRIRRRSNESRRIILHGLRMLRNARLDLIPRELRPMVERLRSRLDAKQNQLENALEEKLRSPDADRRSSGEKKARREFLRRQGVLGSK